MWCRSHCQHRGNSQQCCWGGGCSDIQAYAPCGRVACYAGQSPPNKPCAFKTALDQIRVASHCTLRSHMACAPSAASAQVSSEALLLLMNDKQGTAGNPYARCSRAQEGPSTPTGSPALSKEQMTGQHTQRVASRLRPTSALMGSQGAPTGMEAEHAKRRQDGAVLDSAVLKDIGLTSGEENSDDAWGSSGEEDDEPPTREGLEPNLGDLSLGKSGLHLTLSPLHQC